MVRWLKAGFRLLLRGTLLVLLIGLAGLATYMAATFAVYRGPRYVEPVPQSFPAGALQTPGAVARLEIVQVLRDAADPAASPQVRDLRVDPPAIGAYLPRSGSTQLTLPTPTPTPTPAPYPTSPPLPPPALPELPTLPPPTVPPEAAAPATSVPATSASLPPVDPVNCAPAGMPVDGMVTQRFHAYHAGVDLRAASGTPVLATHSGTVTFAGWSDIGYGYLVVLQSGSFITYYAHNTSLNVTEGQVVPRGSVVALSGSTGNSSGPHVHYETRIDDVPLDPMTFESLGHTTC